MEVGAGAREPRVRADPDPDEEITSGGSCAALPALPGGADAGAVRDAGGDGDLDASRATSAAQLNGACRAGVCLLEGDLGGPLDVVATARHGGSALPGAAGAPEHGVEEVGEGVGVAEHALQLIRRDAAVLHLRTAPAGAANGDAPGRPALSQASYSRQRGPTSSYRRRFSGSPRTSLASLAAL